MPEGPEVRKYADALDEVLSGRVIVSFEARTKEARKWLQHNEERLISAPTARALDRINRIHKIKAGEAANSFNSVLSLIL